MTLSGIIVRLLFAATVLFFVLVILGSLVVIAAPQLVRAFLGE